MYTFDYAWQVIEFMYDLERAGIVFVRAGQSVMIAFSADLARAEEIYRAACAQ